MSEAVQIKLSPKAEALLKTVKEMPSWGMDAICKGMDTANQRAMANITKKHLTGEGPFPPDQHRLGVDTNLLRGSIWVAAATASGTRVDSAIGTNVKYAGIHEFGGTIKHKARTGTSRLLTDKTGNLLRQAANANLAVFARTKKKVRKMDGSFKEVSYTAEAHDVTMPERAPFRTGIQEVLPEYGRLVSAALVKAWPK